MDTLWLFILVGIWSRKEQDSTRQCWGIQKGTGFSQREREETVYISRQTRADDQYTETGHYRSNYKAVLKIVSRSSDWFKWKFWLKEHSLLLLQEDTCIFDFSDRHSHKNHLYLWAMVVCTQLHQPSWFDVCQMKLCWMIFLLYLSWQDFLSTQERLSRAEAQCHHLNTEKELLKSSEQRLLLDIDNLRREKTSQSMLMANLQSIQASLQDSWFIIKLFTYTQWFFVLIGGDGGG